MNNEYDFYLSCIRKRSDSYNKIPMQIKQKYPELAVRHVELYPANFVDIKLQTFRQYLSQDQIIHIINIALNYNIDMIEYIPDDFITAELALKAVSHNGMNIRYIPDELIDFHLCEIAVDQNGCSLEFIPNEFKTEELCITALKTKCNTPLFKYVPFDLRQTQSVYMAALQTDGLSLVYLDVSNLDPGTTRNIVYLKAVEQNGLALKFINLSSLSFKMVNILVLEAVKNNMEAMFSVEQNLFSHINFKMIFENIDVYKFIDCIHSYDQLMIYLKYYMNYVIKFDTEFYIHIFSIYKDLSYIPENLYTREMCIEAIKNDYRQIEYVPNKLLNAEMYYIAANSSKFYLFSNDLIYKKLNDFEIYRCLTILAKNNGYILEENIPAKFITKELCEIAVRQNGTVIRLVPTNFQTEDMCKLAVKQTVNSIQFIPGHISQTFDFIVYSEQCYTNETGDKIQLLLDVMLQFDNKVNGYFSDYTVETEECKTFMSIYIKLFEKLNANYTLLSCDFINSIPGNNGKGIAYNIDFLSKLISINKYIYLYFSDALKDFYYKKHQINYMLLSNVERLQIPNETIANNLVYDVLEIIFNS